MKISPHPDRKKFAARLKVIGRDFDMKMEGVLFRFINPRYSTATNVVNGAGAMHADGRWNLKGTARLSYTATTPDTALAEALAHVNYYRLPLANALPRSARRKSAQCFEAVRSQDQKAGLARRESKGHGSRDAGLGHGLCPRGL